MGASKAILAAALAAAFPAIAEQSARAPRPDTRGKPPAGFVLWFNAALRAQGVAGERPVTICVTRQTISMKTGRSTVVIPVPDATISFKPWESLSWVFFGARKWDVSVPSPRTSVNTFMSGVALPLPAGLPAGLGQVSWQARFESDTTGVSVQWDWGASPYTHFSDNYNGLKVLPVDGAYGDAAGTPVAFRRFALNAGDEHPDSHAFTGPRSGTLKASAPRTTSCGGIY